MSPDATRTVAPSERGERAAFTAIGSGFVDGLRVEHLVVEADQLAPFFEMSARAGGPPPWLEPRSVRG